MPLLAALDEATPGGMLVMRADASPADFHEARRDYALVLVDLGPLARAAESPTLRQCDAACLLVTLRATSRRAAREAVRTLRRRGVAVAGCVLVDDQALASPADSVA